MAQHLALPINKCVLTVMYKEDSAPAYAHEWDSAGHFGLDMYGSPNPFYASGNGVVVGVGGEANIGVGLWVAIQYDNVYQWNMDNNNEICLPSIIMRYFHLNSYNVRKGQQVTLDTKIGTYGNTGELAMGAHLHIEVDTDTTYPLYTPTISTSKGGLRAGIRGEGDTTFDPCSVLYRKTSSPEKQTLSFSQSKCDKHPQANEYYINEEKVNIMKTKTFE